MFIKIFKATVLTNLLFSSLVATAADVTNESNPRLKRATVEVRLLESLASAVPGLASGGLTFEQYIGKNFSLNIGGSYADVDLPMSYVNKITEETDTPMIKDGNGYSAGLGLRYYDSPIGSSLYAGVNVDYSEAENDWKFNSEAYKSDIKALTSSASVGYRWVWQNGFLLRLGAGAALPTVLEGGIAAVSNGPEAAEGKRKIDDLVDQKVLARIDLGVGMMF